MENKISVSIIIPVYNGAEFLRRIFDCAIYQTLKEIEIIAVNDCSPNPRDAEIMREYEDLYPGKFRCIFHEKNTRQGGARNSGIRAARGEYFLCVDQDDYFEPDMCELMYKKGIQEQADLVICGFKVLYSGEEIGRNPVPNFGIESDIYYCRFACFLDNPVWILLAKTEFVKQKGLFFPEAVTCDDVVSYFWFTAANKITRVNKICYHWMQTPHSTSLSMNEHFNSLAPTIERLLTYPFYQSLNAQTRTMLNERLCLFILHIFIVHKYMVKDEAAFFAQVKKILNLLEAPHSCMFLASEIENHFSLPFDIFKQKMMDLWYTENEKLHLLRYLNYKITIWGAGIRGKRLAKTMKELDIPFHITDRDPRKHNNEISGVLVKPWQEVKADTEVVIVAISGVFDEVVEEINDDRVHVVRLEG